MASTNVGSPVRRGHFYIAPRHAAWDRRAAGLNRNAFKTRDEASAALAELSKAAGESTVWDVRWSDGNSQAYDFGRNFFYPDLTQFRDPDAARAARDTWAEAAIKSLGAHECAKRWGLTEPEALTTEVWLESCREYNRGVHDNVCDTLGGTAPLTLHVRPDGSWFFYGRNVSEWDIEAGSNAYLLSGKGAITAQDWVDAATELAILSYEGGEL